MGRFRSIKNSLLGGQVSPTALGRTDLPEYPHSSEILQNMVPMLSGGAYRRPGTLGVANFSMATDHAPRLIPFIVSRTEAYCLYFGYVVGGSPYIVSYRATNNKSGAYQTSNVSGTFLTNFYTATQAFGTGIYDDDIFQFQYCQSADVLYLVHPNWIPQQVLRNAVDSFSVGTFISQLSGLAMAQAYPYLNENATAATMQVSATTGSGVTLTASTATGWGGFKSGHVGAIFRIWNGTAMGAIQITSVSSTTVAVGTVIVPFGDTNAYAAWWESAWSTYRGWPRTVCIFQERLCYGGTLHEPDSIWFSETGNYAKMSALGDLIPAGPIQATGGTVSPPGGSLGPGSNSGVCILPDDSSPGDGQTTGPTGAQPFRITLSQNTLDQIQWMSPDKQLLVGTLSQEWIISPNANTGDFDISDSPTVIQSKYGSDYLPAVRIGYELIFPMVTQDEVRAYQYNYIDASFFAEPVQLFFDQYPQREIGGPIVVGRRKYRQFDWDTTRNTLWCLDTNGNFFGMTRDRKLNATIWHTHLFGGYQDELFQPSYIGTLGSSQTTDPSYYSNEGSVISFAVVPCPVSGINDIWVVRKITLATGGGAYQTNWMVERMIGRNIVRNSAFESVAPGFSAAEPFMVDSAVVALDNGDGTVDYGGCAALGQYSGNGPVDPVGNYYSPEFGIFKQTALPPASGTCVLTGPLSADYGTGTNVVVLGLPFTSIIQPVRIDAGSVIGTSQDAIKRIARAFIRVFKTMSMQVGSPPQSQGGEQEGDQSETNALEYVDFHVNNPPGFQAMGNSAELYTGDKKVLIPSTYDREGYLYITQSDPLPLTIVSIVSEGETFD